MHAQGEDREYVEAAIESGMKILGFSDHAPWVYPHGYISGIRLAPSRVEEYFDSLTSLKEEYKKDIKIYIGFETEYLPALLEDQKKLLEPYPLDYMIMGNHFLGPDMEQYYIGEAFDEEWMLEKYVDLSIQGIESGDYLYLAHPDLPNFRGSDEIYRYHMEPLCHKLKEYNVPLEVNMVGLSENRHYPVGRFWEIAREVGNSAIIGVDAHRPDQLLDHESQKKCEEWVKNYGLELWEYMPELS